MCVIYIYKKSNQACMLAAFFLYVNLIIDFNMFGVLLASVRSVTLSALTEKVCGCYIGS